MSSIPAYAVARDGRVEAAGDLDPPARAILERMARCAYMIDQHRAGIALNSRRMEELKAELRRLESRQ